MRDLNTPADPPQRIPRPLVDDPRHRTALANNQRAVFALRGLGNLARAAA